MRWTEEPSCSSEFSSAGRSILDKLLPKQLRTVSSLPRLTGHYDGDGYTLQVSCFESFPLTWFAVLIEGDGDPLPTLHRICWPHRWGLQDNTGEWLAPETDWETFRQNLAARKRLRYGPPDPLRIPHDDDRFEYVGTYGSDRQFMAFVTGAFPGDNYYPGPSGDWTSHKRWYAVLHHFDAEGDHLGTDAWSGGTTAEGENKAVERAYRKLDEMLASLGEYEFCDIAVKPFQYEQDGYRFALVYELNDEDPEPIPEHVMLWPNDIMFHPPWDSGEYST
jgi:formate hydrogenlyase regulatory protein HycA